MSTAQANVMASFAVALKGATESAALAAGFASIDTELDSMLADPYPSIRLSPLGGSHGTLEGESLWQVVLRFDDLTSDEWSRTVCRDTLIEQLGFLVSGQFSYRTQGDLHNFAVSDSGPVSGKFTAELHGSQTWQIRRDANVWHCSARIKLFY